MCIDNDINHRPTTYNQGDLRKWDRNSTMNKKVYIEQHKWDSVFDNDGQASIWLT